VQVDRIVFDAGASGFHISAGLALILEIDGLGVVNNSGAMQNFVAGAGGNIRFENNSSAGNGTSFLLENKDVATMFGAGIILFDGSASAGSGTFTAPQNPVANSSGGIVMFFDSSTAGNGTFILNGGTVDGAGGAETTFEFNATAGQGTFTFNGGTANNASGAFALFQDTSSAGQATLIANGGLNRGLGGRIRFNDASDGGRARVELFGNSTLDLRGHLPLANVNVGSVEGDGSILLGGNNLMVGSNGLSTTFSGLIQDGQSAQNGGSITKIGTGTLVLQHKSVYPGGTTVKRGKLVVDNVAGSGTGLAAVQVKGGELGGRGIIAGAVTIGTGSGAGAVVAPGEVQGVGRAGTLTISSLLTFKADGTLEVQVNSSRSTADQVAALGISINNGAQFSFADIGSGTLPPGTVFTIINNTSANPISGTFSNLPDGSIFTANRNTYQVSYEGGDGNDLTLTVVP
jgi:autotransporter-associated beta strand protein